MPGERSFHHRPTVSQVTPRERGIRANDPACAEEMAQATVSEIGFGNQHESRGIAVESMHDSRATLDPATECRSASDQRIDQRVVPMAGRGMNDEPGRLVDDGKVLVFPDDRERNVRWTQLTRRAGRRHSPAEPPAPT